MISQDQKNLVLYGNYARVLRSQKKVKEARQVYTQCIATMQTDESVHDEELRLSLLLDWALMEGLVGEESHCLNVLLLVANENMSCE